MTQDKEQRDVSFIKVGPVKIDKSLSIPNLIQISLLIFAIWMGGYKLYDEFSGLQEQIQGLNQELVAQSNHYSSTLSTYDARMLILSDKVSVVTTDLALNKQRTEALMDSIEKLTMAIEKLRESQVKK